MMKVPFHIRPVTIEDVESFFELMSTNRERLKLYFPISSGQVRNRKSAKKFIEEKLNNTKQKKQFAFVIEPVVETQYITSSPLVQGIIPPLAGYIIIKNIDWTKKDCELAYWLGQGYEGKGMMSYSIKHIIQFCFNYLQLNRIYLRIDPANQKSRNLAERSGFTIHHTAEKEYRRGDGIWVDVEYWELIILQNKKQ